MVSQSLEYRKEYRNSENIGSASEHWVSQGIADI